jgi:hypothetical protein
MKIRPIATHFAYERDDKRTACGLKIKGRDITTIILLADCKNCWKEYKRRYPDVQAS